MAYKQKSLRKHIPASFFDAFDDRKATSREVSPSGAKSGILSSKRGPAGSLIRLWLSSLLKPLPERDGRLSIC